VVNEMSFLLIFDFLGPSHLPCVELFSWKNLQLYGSFLIILLSSDVELNPGPLSYPCSICCKRAIRRITL